MKDVDVNASVTDRHVLRLPMRCNSYYVLLRFYGAFVDIYRRFGRAYRPHLQMTNSLRRPHCLTLEDGTQDSSETSELDTRCFTSHKSEGLISIYLRRHDVRQLTGFIWLKMWTSGRLCEHGDEHFVFSSTTQAGLC